MARTFRLVALVACLTAAGCRDSGGRAETPSVSTASDSQTAVAPPADSAAPGVCRPFDRLPVLAGEVVGWRPLGMVAAPIHVFPAKHSAFVVNPPGAAARTVSLVFPGAATVTEVVDTRTGEHHSYQLFFEPCRQVRVYIGHIGSLSTVLQGAIANARPRCQSYNFAGQRYDKCHYQLALPVASGDQLGRSDGLAGVDFGVTDFNRPALGFVVPEHYNHDWLFTANPMDYFAPAARAELAGLASSVDGKRRRTAEPIGGLFMNDIAGTAQGNWFSKGHSMHDRPDGDGFIALVPDFVEPTRQIVSVGPNIEGIRAGIYEFEPASAGRRNRPFRDVAPGATYCYEGWLTGTTVGGIPRTTLIGVLLIDLPDSRTLRVEPHPAASCDSAPDRLTKPAAFTR